MQSNKKAISSIVASLLLAVAVLGVIGMLYVWSSGYAQEKTQDVSDQILSMQDYATKQKAINVFKLTNDGKIYLENLGVENFTIDSIKIDNNEISISNTLIEPGNFAIIKSNKTLEDGNFYQITITTTNGIGKTIKQKAVFVQIVQVSIAGGINPSVSTTTSTVTWTTNIDSNSFIEYGLTTSYGSTSSSAEYTKNHSISLTGLTAGTIYHYRITSCTLTDCTNSSDYTFTTNSAALALSSISSGSVTSSSALISWTTNNDANSLVQYGLTTSYGSTDSNATNATSHAIDLNSLSANTLYHYKITSCTSITDCSSSSDYNFTTSETTIALSDINSSALTSSSAQINWTTNIDANSLVQYGLTTSYGSTDSNSSTTQGHALSLSGLNSSTIYHYKITSCASITNCASSSDYNFTTSAVVWSFDENFSSDTNISTQNDANYNSITSSIQLIADFNAMIPSNQFSTPRLIFYDPLAGTGTDDHSFDTSYNGQVSDDSSNNKANDVNYNAITLSGKTVYGLERRNWKLQYLNYSPTTLTTQVRFNDSNGTVQFWVSMDGNGARTGAKRFFTSYNSGGDRFYTYIPDNNLLTLVSANETQPTYNVSTWRAATPHLITMTWNAQDENVYVDGIKRITKTSTTSSWTMYQSIFFGSWTTNTQFLDGAMYGISSYNYVKPDAVIKQDFNRGLSHPMFNGPFLTGGAIKSQAIDSTDSNIASATLTAVETKPTNTTISYWLSNDNGTTWASATNTVQVTFATSGSQLKWRADLNSTDINYTPVINSLNISYQLAS